MAKHSIEQVILFEWITVVILHYVGRKDHQIKLHGQRIELEEIEQCLLNITSISGCVVMKWDDDHLVAYVQSAANDEKEVREYCHSHLPPHMIPSKFIILKELPLNSNGKVDRALLPTPDLSYPSLTQFKNDTELLVPTNTIEVIIHHMWCEIFQQHQISIDVNIFSIGGHSLLLLQLLHRYKTEFHLKTNIVSIADLFQYPTITDHARFVSQILDHIQSIDEHYWSPLHLKQGKNNLL